MPVGLLDITNLWLLLAFVAGAGLTWLFARGRLLASRLHLDAAEREATRLQQELTDSRQQLRQLQQEQLELTATIASLQAHQHGAEEKIQLLQQTRDALTREFENLANRIFEEKQARFSQSSRLTWIPH